MYKIKMARDARINNNKSFAAILAKESTKFRNFIIFINILNIKADFSK
jgi:hypothetical protein